MLGQIARRDGGGKVGWDVGLAQGWKGGGHGRCDVGDPEAEDGNRLRIILGCHGVNQRLDFQSGGSRISRPDATLCWRRMINVQKGLAKFVLTRVQATTFERWRSSTSERDHYLPRTTKKAFRPN